MRADNKVYSSSKQNSNCNAAHVTRLTPPNVCGQDLMQTQFSIAKRYKGSQKKMRDDCDYKENEITPKWNDTATILEGSISVLPSPCLSRACAQKGLSGHDSLSRIQPTQQCCFAPSSLTFEFLWTAKQRTSFRVHLLSTRPLWGFRFCEDLLWVITELCESYSGDYSARPLVVL